MATMTLKDLNEEYGRFWKGQTELLHQRMANAIVREVALRLIREQEIMGVPTRYRLSVEKALQNAEIIGKQFSAGWSRKGGKAKKTDTLQLLIEKIVEGRASITVRQLEHELHARHGIEVIDEIADGMISFTAANGLLKEARLSALKHRLSRAKKELRSR